MSASYEHFKGPFVGLALVKAKPGKAEAVAKSIAAIKASATSDAEPGCLGYHAIRSEDEFVIWEKYATVDALKVDHINTEAGKALMAIRGEIVEEFKIKFYEEI